MTLCFDSKKFMDSGLPLVDYMILLAYEQDSFVGKEIAHLFKINLRTVRYKRSELCRDGYLEKDGMQFYLTNKSRGLIAA